VGQAQQRCQDLGGWRWNYARKRKEDVIASARRVQASGYVVVWVKKEGSSDEGTSFSPRLKSLVYYRFIRPVHSKLAINWMH
jgi:hypothetical protein